MDINKKECPEGLEILEYGGKGYDRTMHFGEWRVAFLNWAEKFDKGSDFPAERHLLTDEVFVLLAGSATLYIGAELAPVRLGSKSCTTSGQACGIRLRSAETQSCLSSKTIQPVPKIRNI